MSKKEKNEKLNNEQPRKIKVHEDVKTFSKLTFKKYKKEMGYSKGEDAKEDYRLYLIELLPDVIDFIINFGHIQDEHVQSIKNTCFTKISDPKFIKTLRKEIKDDVKIKNIKLMPIIISEMITSIQKVNAENAANNSEEIYDMSDLVKLTQLILKKPLKKFDKEGIAEDLAFDVLSIIPTEDALKKSSLFRIRRFFEVLFEHAKTKENIPVDKIIKLVGGKDNYPLFVVFALLERKEVFGKLTDKQKVLYLAISNWAFNVLENEFDNELRKDALMTYAKSRARDAAKNKDSNRRFALTNLSETDYPKINKTLTFIMNKDEKLKQYFN